MNLFKCPICDEPLIDEAKTMYCSHNHRFDKAKGGSVNLLQSQRSKQRQHGDDKAMVVARTRFLETGHYLPFRNVIETIFEGNGQTILDIGCGEGWYATPLCQNHTMYGIDISKHAIEKAVKRNKTMHCAVASSFSLPFMDASFDGAYVIFAPYDVTEVVRVLKDDGLFVEVFPLENHLMGMKGVLYDKPYMNDVEVKEIAGMTCVDVIRVEETIQLSSQEMIHDLFSMTPYYHRTPQTAKEVLQNMNHLETQIAFGFAIYRKSTQ